MSAPTWATAMSTRAPEGRALPPATGRTVLPIVGASVAGNLVIFGVASALQVGFRITTPLASGPETVTWVSVLVMSLVPLLLGAAVLWGLKRWTPTSWRVLAWLGLVVGVATMPLFGEATLATRVSLSLMHLLPAVLWWVGVRRAVAS